MWLASGTKQYMMKIVREIGNQQEKKTQIRPKACSTNLKINLTIRMGTRRQPKPENCPVKIQERQVKGLTKMFKPRTNQAATFLLPSSKILSKYSYPVENKTLRGRVKQKLRWTLTVEISNANLWLKNTKRRPPKLKECHLKDVKVTKITQKKEKWSFWNSTLKRRQICEIQTIQPFQVCQQKKVTW